MTLPPAIRKVPRLTGRPHPLHLFIFFALCCLYFLAQPAVAAEGLMLSPVEAWSNVFGGREVIFRFTVRGADAVRARVGWGFAVDGRTLARGEVPQEKPGVVAVKLVLPEVKPGVILPAVLDVTATVAGETVTLQKRLWLFPASPFTDRAEWLKRLDIRLYDPERTTADSLTAMEVPFTPVGNLESLTEPGTSVVLIGEGLSFEDYRALPEVMVQAAANGHPVICLAPTGGLLPIPGTGGVELPAPGRIALQRYEIITALDKRLDAVAWPAGDPAVAGLTIRCEDDLVAGDVVKGRAGWPWLELTYPHAGSRLIVAGFGIIARWEDSPTPRFLLARLLEYVTALQPIEEIPIKEDTR